MNNLVNWSTMSNLFITYSSIAPSVGYAALRITANQTGVKNDIPLRQSICLFLFSFFPKKRNLNFE